MSNDTNRLIAFVCCLITILLLSKIGGTGADLAIMTGIVALAGGLLNIGGQRKVEIDNKEDNPVPTKDTADETEQHIQSDPNGHRSVQSKRGRTKTNR